MEFSNLTVEVPWHEPLAQQFLTAHLRLDAAAAVLRNNAIQRYWVCTRSTRQAEFGSTLTMLDRTAERFDLRPDWLVADTAYGSEESLVEIVLKRQILPFIPVIDKGERTDGTLSRSDLSWDEENDRYVCPQGKELHRTRRNYSDPACLPTEMKPRRYRAAKADCQACPMKAQCCPKSETRRLQRGKYEMVRNLARTCTASAFNETAARRRKKVEMLFAHLKRILGLTRLRLRGRWV